MSKHPFDFCGWTCPAPLRNYPDIVLGHGGGGKLSAELIQHLFIPAFANDTLNELGDCGVFNIQGQRLAFSTDSFVVRPLFFPGGCIGDLAVNGTVNDIAMSGATPVYMSAGFIIEEGLSINTLGEIVERMAVAAHTAGIQLVTGDTKVVEKGHGDGIYINTSGIGIVPDEISISPKNALPGDVVIVSGTIGDHGMAILSVREGLEFDSQLESDSVALNSLVQAILSVTSQIHVLRDPTRGGVASALNEIATASGCGIIIEEALLPVKPTVRSACELLGMDPLYVANEGKLIAIVPETEAAMVLEIMKQHPHGESAAIIGQIVDTNRGLLLAQTPLGTRRIVDMQVGEQLPRIC